MQTILLNTRHCWQGCGYIGNGCTCTMKCARTNGQCGEDTDVKCRSIHTFLSTTARSSTYCAASLQLRPFISTCLRRYDVKSPTFRSTRKTNARTLTCSAACARNTKARICLQCGLEQKKGSWASPCDQTKAHSDLIAAWKL